MKNYLTVIALLLWSTVVLAQKDDSAKENEDGLKISSFTAQFLISSDFKSAMYFNVVGGGLKYTRRNLSISISLFPTLRFHKDPHEDPTDDLRPFVTPGFSVGPLFQYKRFMLGFPVSYSYDSKWHPTMGMGIKFGKL